MEDKRVKVLYIGGYSRSGSTLLLRLLGQIEGFFSVGEIWDIWHRSFAENQLCGCDHPFRECDFWQAVVDNAFGGFDQVDVEAMQALRQSVQGNRYIPFLGAPFLRPRKYQQRLNTYAGILDKLYQGINRVSGDQIIVDSSKVPSYAFVLKEAPNIDLHIVHLVRDSRATAYSWQRKKIRPEIYWKKTYMDRYSPRKAALEWNIMNWWLHKLKNGGTKYTLIRYEDLVCKPRQSIHKIMNDLNLDMPGDEFFDGEQAVHFGIDHTVSGNPNRFQRGAVKIIPDNEWQEKMSGLHKGIVTSLTWPLLLKYGYLGHKTVGADCEQADGHKSNGRTKQAELSNIGPLRILLVTARYLPHVGGTEIHTYELAQRLVAEGHDVTVLTTDLKGTLPDTDVLGGIKIKRVRAWPANSDYFFAPDIYSYIVHGEWDVIHCQGYHTLVAPMVMLAARRVKIPYIVTFHSGGHSSWLRNAIRPLQRALLRPLLAKAAALIAVSRWEADYFRQHLGFPPDQFMVIPNGSYLKRVDNHNLPLARENGTLIVSVGRLEQYKGHHRVIAALPLLMEQIPGVHLRIIGSGPYEEELRRLAHELNVADRVEIKAVSGEDREGMAEVLLGASLVILLSNYESQGISVMESLALGRPVLVADGTALHELVASGLARATPLGSTAQEIAIAILDQLQQPLIPGNPELPTWEACASKVSDLYKQTVSER